MISLLQSISELGRKRGKLTLCPLSNYKTTTTTTTTSTTTTTTKICIQNYDKTMNFIVDITSDLYMYGIPF